MRAVSPAAVARRAVRPLGLADVVVDRDAPRADGDAAGGSDSAAPAEAPRRVGGPVVGTPRVQQQLDKLRAHLEAHPLADGASARRARRRRGADGEEASEPRPQRTMASRRAPAKRASAQASVREQRGAGGA